MVAKEDQEILRLLVQHVARAFYEPKYTIILDQLARHPVLKDDDLAGRMGLQPKELNKLIAVLSNDSLIKVHRQNELKENAQRAVGRQYYYIDYGHFVNVVKWRVAKMRHIIDSSLRNELDNKGYICTQCKQQYYPLDVDRLMDYTQGVLICEICRAEVVDNENSESVLGSKDRMQRFNHQMRFIRAGLQKSENMRLSAFDVNLWVKVNGLEGEKKKSSASNDDLKIAGSDGSRQEDGIQVLIAMDKNEAQMKLERDAEAEAKRQQNALPSWHMKSTISGDLTALGIKESARIENSSIAAASSDVSLKGLGIVGLKPQPGTSSHKPLVMVQEDVKPDLNKESNLYDQYYASLAASSTGSAQPTPPSQPESSEFSDTNGKVSTTGWLEGQEEEDRKPKIEHLNSLNEYRKRSRSREDDGGMHKQAKVAKIEPVAPVLNKNGFGDTAHASFQALAEPARDEFEEANSSGEALDDPLIYVNGAPKPYSQVTDEDHELMTPEEYEEYFRIFEIRS